MTDSLETKRKRDEKPNRSLIQLARMGMVYFGIEMMFSIEIALTVPILLKLKVSEKVYSYVYFLSPLLGFLFQPILGSMSDRCESPYGRRRPFIFALSIVAFIGIALILNGHSLGLLFGDMDSDIPIIAIILVGIGVTLLDFAADSCDSPVRAFLLDECNSRDQDTGLNVHAFLGGIGAATGYLLTSIDWDNTIFSKAIGDEMQVLFVLTSGVFFLTVFLTLTSVKEEQFKLHKRFKNKQIDNSIELGEKDKEQNMKLLLIDNINHGEEEINEEEPLGFKTLFLSFVYMPDELSKLFICQVIGWIAFFSTTLFFTDFIAQSIYKGDPAALIETAEFYLYNYGTRMGSLCLIFFSLSSSFSAVIVEKFLLKEFSTKTIFLFTYFFYLLCCIAIYSLNDIYSIIPFCSSFGLLMTILTTLPYQMLSEFHQDENYVNNCKTAAKRGMGIDCSLLSSAFFLAQLIVSSFMSLLISAHGNRVILVAGGFFAFIGIIFVNFYVIFPKNNPSTKHKEYRN